MLISHKISLQPIKKVAIGVSFTLAYHVTKDIKYFLVSVRVLILARQTFVWASLILTVSHHLEIDLELL